MRLDEHDPVPRGAAGRAREAGGGGVVGEYGVVAPTGVERGGGEEEKGGGGRSCKDGRGGGLPPPGKEEEGQEHFMRCRLLKWKWKP